MSASCRFPATSRQRFVGQTGTSPLWGGQHRAGQPLNPPPVGDCLTRVGDGSGGVRENAVSFLAESPRTGLGSAPSNAQRKRLFGSVRTTSPGPSWGAEPDQGGPPSEPCSRTNIRRHQPGISPTLDGGIACAAHGSRSGAVWIEIRPTRSSRRFHPHPPTAGILWTVPHPLLDRAACIGARAIFDRTVLPRKPARQTRSGGVGQSQDPT